MKSLTITEYYEQLQVAQTEQPLAILREGATVAVFGRHKDRRDCAGPCNNRDRFAYVTGLLPNHFQVPAVIYDVYHGMDALPYTHIYERTGTIYYFNKLVFTCPRE